MKKADILNMTPDELKGFLAGLGEPPYRAKQILEWVWHRGVSSFTEMTNLPASLRGRLNNAAVLGSLDRVASERSADGTEKLLFSLADGQTVETVILPYDIGSSACISTQVGCRMGCLFCASGRPGFVRNLTAGEILAQVRAVRRVLQGRGQELKNMVLMGSGEPLDNWDSTIAFLEAVRDPLRLGMSVRHVTLSTSGLVPQIRQLAGLGWPLNLAVSLHAPDNALRNRIMPINKKYPLEELLPACDLYAKATGRRVTYEYVLIAGLNDGPGHARELTRLLNGRLCHVNLIPLNSVPELNLQPSPQAEVKMFRDILKNKGVNATVRRKMGADIAAACGQLRNNFCGERDTARSEYCESGRD